jgi:L-threonylcarbamoyladenylate synthase
MALCSDIRRGPSLMRVQRVRAPLDQATLFAAAQCIRAGGTLIFPTDTVYGIGCDPYDAAAVDDVFAAKRRPLDRPLAIHVADPRDAEAFGVLTRQARVVMERFWPGAVAIVVERKSNTVEAAARGGHTISLRCPAYAPCIQILHATGPLAATSANLSGQPAFTGTWESIKELPDATLAIITGPTPSGRESTIVDCTQAPVQILREGVLSRQEIESALKSAGVAVADR